MCPLRLGSLSKFLNCYYEKIVVKLNPKKFIKTLTAKKTNTEVFVVTCIRRYQGVAQANLQDKSPDR